jgi:hypothetical protein
MLFHRRELKLSAAALLFAILSLSAHMSANAALLTTTSNRDTVIVAGSAGNTAFNVPQFYVGRAATEDRSLLGFDIASIGASVASVSSMTLTLHVHSTSFATPSTTINTQVHAVLPGNKDWAQGVSSWNNKIQSSTTPWTGTPATGLTIAGTDYDPALLASNSLSSTDPTPSTMVFNFSGDLTGLVNSWLSGNNAGLLLFDTNLTATNVYVVFHGSGSSAELRPELSINYIPTLVPEPSGLMLLLFGMICIAMKRRK